MDFDVDLDVTCEICGKNACRLYKIGNDYMNYKCFSGCGEYTIKGEPEPKKELVDTKPIKKGKSK
jgi:hypothetical protein